MVLETRLVLNEPGEVVWARKSLFLWDSAASVRVDVVDSEGSVSNAIRLAPIGIACAVVIG